MKKQVKLSSLSKETQAMVKRELQTSSLVLTKESLRSLIEEAANNTIETLEEDVPATFLINRERLEASTTHLLEDLEVLQTVLEKNGNRITQVKNDGEADYDAPNTQPFSKKTSDILHDEPGRSLTLTLSKSLDDNTQEELESLIDEGQVEIYYDAYEGDKYITVTYFTSCIDYETDKKSLKYSYSS